ncbi:MAG TPA: cupin domain-containing protein [Pirellulaceae bacterium]|nr:cupin domain-containing protein [Pirellulaceae bacterium]
MKVSHYETVEQQPVDMSGSHRCHVRYLIGPRDAAPNFAMRQFEVEPGGFTPRHSHPYEHEVFVLAGRGEVFEGDLAHPIAAGDIVYVAPNEIHQFRNLGEESLKFLCLVPNQAATLPVTLAPECGSEANC